MANLDGISRVGRSQGASIFWGLVSVFFAAAACFYFWKNHENEATTNKLRDQVMNLQELNESLTAQKEKLQAGISETTNQLKAREDFLQDKEAKLAAEESRIEALPQQAPAAKPQPPPAVAATPTQTAVIKKFSDTIQKLDKDAAGDVIERDGRPVLRVPNTILFAPGEAVLKPEGKTLLTQLAQGLNNQLDTFELRVSAYTDTDAEPPKADGAKPRYATSWDLTAARATAISKFYRDQTQLPFQNVLVQARGDADPITTSAKEGHAHNRRVEFTVVPVPVAFHATPSLEPPPDSPAPAPKPKAKDKTAADASGDSTPAPKPKAKDKDAAKDKSN